MYTIVLYSQFVNSLFNFDNSTFCNCRTGKMAPLHNTFTFVPCNISTFLPQCNSKVVRQSTLVARHLGENENSSSSGARSWPYTHYTLFSYNSKKSGKSAALSSIVFGQMHNSGFAKKQPNVLRAQVVSLQFKTHWEATWARFFGLTGGTTMPGC